MTGVLLLANAILLKIRKLVMGYYEPPNVGALCAICFVQLLVIHARTWRMFCDQALSI